MSIDPANRVNSMDVKMTGTGSSQKKQSIAETVINFLSGDSESEKDYPGLGIEKSAKNQADIYKIAARELEDLDRAVERQERRIEKAQKRMEKYGSARVSQFGYQKMQEELAELKADRDNLAKGENVDEILEKYAPKSMERLEKKEERPIRKELNKVESEIKKKTAQLYRTRDYGEDSESAKIKAELSDLNNRKAELELQLKDTVASKMSQAEAEFIGDKNKTENTSLPKRVSTANPDEVNEICDDMFKAIDGLGTDDELFEKTLSRLNKDNIIEVMEKWDETYGKDYNESFMDSFLDDADGIQKKEFGTKIVDMLEQRAKENGLDFAGKSSSLKMELKREQLTFKTENLVGYQISQMYGEIRAKEQNDV